MLLNGLRRTGKTVMAQQAIAELPDAVRAKTAFIKISQKRTVPNLPVFALVEDLFYEGFRTFFVDECTSMLDFPVWAKDMADGPAARGYHVVLLGTDSLSMWLARREFLEGRYNEIRTTRIPFHEWRRLLARDDRSLSVKDYVRYGGILDFEGVPVDSALVPESRHSFRDTASIDWYVHSSIALNIQNALARHAGGDDFGDLRSLWEDGRLTEAIARVVQDQNHRLARDRLHLRFAHGDFYEAYKAVGKLNKKARSFVKEQKEAILQEIEERLCLSSGGLEISKKEADLILEYLHRIDVFKDADVLLMPSTDPKKRRRQRLYKETVRILQTQPGIRSGQMRLACGVIWDVLKINRAPIAKETFLRESTGAVQGQMLEDIVFADLMDVLPEGCRIYRLEWKADPGETAAFDCAVVDERNPLRPRVSLFEVKHADSMRGDAARHLKNPQAIAQVAEAFGTVVSRAVVYNGETDRRAVLWISADELLGYVGRDPEGCLFPQLSSRWSPLVPLEPWMAKAAVPCLDAEGGGDDPMPEQAV
ncbi:MAG: AAA family ATPase, partial [Desulfovibrio sp.]|nr:AAA family ATPase [Desulfovibrio sp.]